MFIYYIKDDVKEKDGTNVTGEVIKPQVVAKDPPIHTKY